MGTTGRVATSFSYRRISCTKVGYKRSRRFHGDRRLVGEGGPPREEKTEFLGRTLGRNDGRTDKTCGGVTLPRRSGGGRGSCENGGEWRWR